MTASEPILEAHPNRLGPYRIEHQIGRGGMGAVYRAHDERLERPVALKRLRPCSSAEASHLAHEARAIAQLSHPNIVQVYDLLNHGDCDWIVMELVDGPTLLQLLKRRALEVDEVVGWALGITRGLAAAHARGVVHRDLKTENVMISADGEAKILDFGLATGPCIQRPRRSPARIQGTPRSMAPEQVLGSLTDHRADLFSLGVLLYECLVGRSPFSAPHLDVHQTLWRVCTFCPPPLSERRPDVPAELSRLVDHLLEKEPPDRPESAEDVLLALQRARDAAPAKTRVLFVDDEPDFEHLVRRWADRNLDGRRFELVFANNGAKALDRLRADSTLQLVFTDLRMPVMDGLQLLAEMAKLEDERVAVVVSAFGDMSSIRSAMNLGAFDFLIKPFDLDDLATTLDKAARHLATLRETARLRAENGLLDERNKLFRLAFSRHLGGDLELGRVLEPLIERARAASERQLTMVSLEIDGFAELPEHLPGGCCLALVGELVTELVATVQRHRGEILGFDGGRLSIGFECLEPPAADDEHATDCADSLQREVEAWALRVVESGGPPVAARLVVDAGDVIVDAESGRLSGNLTARAGRFLSGCSPHQVFVADTVHSTLAAPPST